MPFPKRAWVDMLLGQLVRCGTSPAPNYEEACAAESRADFADKLSICLKELRESRCWIRLIIKTEMLKEHKVSELLDECNQLCNIIAIDRNGEAEQEGGNCKMKIRN